MRQVRKPHCDLIQELNDTLQDPDWLDAGVARLQRCSAQSAATWALTAKSACFVHKHVSSWRGPNTRKCTSFNPRRPCTFWTVGAQGVRTCLCGLGRAPCALPGATAAAHHAFALSKTLCRALCISSDFVRTCYTLVTCIMHVSRQSGPVGRAPMWPIGNSSFICFCTTVPDIILHIAVSCLQSVASA